MGLFGKKKTPEETVAEGRVQFESGDFKKAFLTLHGLANKGEPEASYYIGLYWLREKHDKGMAKKYLTTAAKAHMRDAAQLLAAEYGIRDYLPKDAAPQPAPEPAPKAEAPAEKPKPEPEPAPKAPAPAQKPAPQPKPAPKADPKAEAPDQEAERYFREAAAAQKAGDPAKCLALREKAAELGHTEAQFQCGRMYDRGEGTPADKTKALHWYETAAEQGHVDAQFFCGVMYDAGDGTARDRDKARTYFQMAAKQGDEEAAQMLADLFRLQDDLPKDAAPQSKPEPKPAPKTVAPAPAQNSVPQPKPAPKAAPKAEVPDPEPQVVFQSGMRSYMAKDYTKALSFFAQAAEQGHADAQFNCGVMYYRGEGTAPDKAKALYWYEKVAEQGHAQAQDHEGLEGGADLEQGQQGAAVFQQGTFQHFGLGFGDVEGRHAHGAGQEDQVGQQGRDHDRVEAQGTGALLPVHDGQQGELGTGAGGLAHQHGHGQQDHEQGGLLLDDLAGKDSAVVIEPLSQVGVVHQAGLIDLLFFPVGEDNLVVLDVHLADVVVVGHGHKGAVIHLLHPALNQHGHGQEIEQQQQDEHDDVVEGQRLLWGFDFFHGFPPSSFGMGLMGGQWFGSEYYP